MNNKIVLLFISSAVLALTASVSVPSKTEDEAAIYIDGIDVTKLSEEDLKYFVDVEDQELELDLNIQGYINANSVEEKAKRQKRWIPLVARALWAGGRALFGGASRGAISRSGSRITRQYTKPGGYNAAVRDFNRFKPSGIKNINTNKLQGMTGQVGRHRFTVRSSSSSGRPTLEIRSPKNGGTFVRKVRY